MAQDLSVEQNQVLVICGVHLLSDRNLSLVAVHVLDATTPTALAANAGTAAATNISARITAVATSFVIFSSPSSLGLHPPFSPSTTALHL